MKGLLNMNENDYVMLYQDKQRFMTQVNRWTHPLDGPYYSGYGEDLLTFSPGHLSLFPELFHDVIMYGLTYYADRNFENDPRDLWANPLRVDTLSRLCQPNKSWYFTAKGWVPTKGETEDFVSLETYLLKNLIKDHHLEYVYLPSGAFFFEVPYVRIPEVVNSIWVYANEGTSIQGYLLLSHHMQMLEEWGRKTPSPVLFREVIDACDIVFHTFPAEHNNFYFYTNKWQYKKLEQRLNIAFLQQSAAEILSKI